MIPMYDFMAFMDYIDLTVRCPRKAIKSLLHSLVLNNIFKITNNQKEKKHIYEV